MEGGQQRQGRPAGGTRGRWRSHKGHHSASIHWGGGTNAAAPNDNSQRRVTCMTRLEFSRAVLQQGMGFVPGDLNCLVKVPGNADIFDVSFKNSNVLERFSVTFKLSPCPKRKAKWSLCSFIMRLCRTTMWVRGWAGTAKLNRNPGECWIRTESGPGPGNGWSNSSPTPRQWGGCMSHPQLHHARETPNLSLGHAPDHPRHGGGVRLLIHWLRIKHFHTVAKNKKKGKGTRSPTTANTQRPPSQPPNPAITHHQIHTKHQIQSNTTPNTPLTDRLDPPLRPTKPLPPPVHHKENKKNPNTFHPHPIRDQPAPGPDSVKGSVTSPSSQGPPRAVGRPWVKTPAPTSPGRNLPGSWEGRLIGVHGRGVSRQHNNPDTIFIRWYRVWPLLFRAQGRWVRALVPLPGTVPPPSSTGGM